MGEQERAEKFVTLAEVRTNKAINAIRLIGNLSNRANYKYTDDQVEQIFAALEAHLKETKKRFASNEEKDVFKLKATSEAVVPAEEETP